ncbi:MAG: fibronectin type III domain-containing protein [Bdellovibrionota bacterium]
MKFLVSLLAFVITTILSVQSLASESANKSTELFPPKQANKTLSTPPAATMLASPAFMAKISGNEVTLKWSPVEGVENYHLQVATDPVYKWITAEEQLFNGTSYELKNLETGKHYYWRVAAVKPGNMASYSKSEFKKSMFETQEK